LSVSEKKSKTNIRKVEDVWDTGPFLRINFHIWNLVTIFRTKLFLIAFSHTLGLLISLAKFLFPWLIIFRVHVQWAIEYVTSE
jgi:hypothetical protein